MQFRPTDIAKKLNISTSLLRNYEKLNLLPAPERSPSGYRIYTVESFLYFKAIRTLTVAYGYSLTKNIMNNIQQKEFHEALWLLNREHVYLEKQKRLTDRVLNHIHNNQMNGFIKLPKKAG